MHLLRFVLAVTFTLALANPAAAQRYTAKQNGDIIEIADRGPIPGTGFVNGNTNRG